MSSLYTPSSLAGLFVFNPTLGDEATEGLKILTFHPKIDIDRQKTYVGLTEGLVAFTRDYSPEKPLEAMHTEKHRYAFFECEKDYWMVLVVENPRVAKDAKSAPVYAEDELDDSILQSLLKHAYSLFSLFNGTMATINAECGDKFLRERLELFFQFYLPTVKFNQLRFFMDITGFQFFPVDKATFLSIACLSDSIGAAFPEVHSTSVLFDGRLIWSGLDQANMRVLYNLQQENFKPFFNYLALNESRPEERQLPPSAAAAASASAAAQSRESSLAAQNDGLPAGVFLTGPLRKGGVVSQSAPRVFLDAKRVHRLVAFQIGKLCVLFLLREPPPSAADASASAPLHAHADASFYRRLEEHFAPDLRKLTLALIQQAPSSAGSSGSSSSASSSSSGSGSASDSSPDDAFRFLYFNHMNLALKTSLSSKSAPLTVEVIKVLRAMHADFIRAGADAHAQGPTEVCVRTRADGWVIGRRSTQTSREFFVLLDERAGELTDVSARVDRLAAEHFNIFIDQKASIL